MTPLFEVKAIDRDFYQQRLQGFLPGKLLDIHTHVWLDQFQSREKEEAPRAVTWPQRVAVDNSIEDLQETYGLMFPAQTVTPLIFGMALSRQDDLDGGNEYVRQRALKHQVPALIFADPKWSAAELESRRGISWERRFILPVPTPRLPGAISRSTTSYRLTSCRSCTSTAGSPCSIFPARAGCAIP
jgi:hypothetical protein